MGFGEAAIPLANESVVVTRNAILSKHEIQGVSANSRPGTNICFLKLSYPLTRNQQPATSEEVEKMLWTEVGQDLTADRATQQRPGTG